MPSKHHNKWQAKKTRGQGWGTFYLGLFNTYEEAKAREDAFDKEWPPYECQVIHGRRRRKAGKKAERSNSPSEDELNKGLMDEFMGTKADPWASWGD